jgi:LuxR family maltose regulon positive regulatory protein
LGLAKIAFLQSDNTQAYALLEESKAHGQRYALMDWKYKYYLLLARIYCSEGLYDLARDCINESKIYHHINPVPEDIGIDEVEKQIEDATVHHRIDQPLGVKDENELVFKKERVNQLLSEPLTVRELEVLSLIVSGLSNQQICDQLFLALSTVKGYNQNIFGKLDVNRRTQAVAKARELGLV